MEKDISSLKKGNEMLIKQVESQKNDITSLKNQNENQTQEIAQLKSLVQHLLNLQQPDDLTTSKVSDKDILTLPNNERSARSTKGEPTAVGKGVNPAKITTAKPRMLSNVVYELKQIVAGEISV